MMKKRKPITTGTVIIIGIFALVVFGGASAMLFDPNNDSGISNWFKVNFFPADNYGLTSILDAEDSAYDASENYRGSTSMAWMLCICAMIIVLTMCFVFFAKERGIL
jgi:uncharacterized membrane protein YhaH (DUF805 family)